MSKVFIEKVTPQDVVSKYEKLIKTACPVTTNQPVVIKLNLSWSKFYPACSSPPWQLEGVIKGLLALGISPQNIIPVENKTVVTNVQKGAHNHGWDKVCEKYGVKFHYLTDEKYVLYKPKSKMLVLDQIFPDGILLPEIIFNKPLITLCTLKTHVFTKTTGSIKNYFGMLTTKRHWAHRFIHEAIIDLLQIQKELHPQILGVMDGSVLGHGPGPRCMEWEDTGLVLASEDEVSLDATAANIIGIDPLQIKYLGVGKKLGLGENDPEEIEIEGVKELPRYEFNSGDTLASKGQKLIYHGLPLWFEKLILHTFVTPWSYVASRLYHDVYWYNFIGKGRISKYMKNRWGKLLRNYIS